MKITEADVVWTEAQTFLAQRLAAAGNDGKAAGVAISDMAAMLAKAGLEKEEARDLARKIAEDQNKIGPGVDLCIDRGLAGIVHSDGRNGAKNGHAPEASPQPQPKPGPTQHDIEAEFLRALDRADIVAPRRLLTGKPTSGKLHRCNAKGKGGKGDAAYLLYIGTTRDGQRYGLGGFQNWRTSSEWTSWESDTRELDKAERDAIAQKRREAAAAHEADKQKRQAEARDQAQRELDASTPLADDHPYLQRKGVRAHGLTADRKAILVPMRDAAGVLHNRQKIGPDGTKRFLFGGRVDGCFHLLGTIGDRFCIAEGFATAATIHEATGLPVAIAFDSGNLPKVARALRERYPNAKILIAVDDDWKTKKPDGTPHNPGRIKATEAAEAIAGVLVMPQFGLGREDGHTDFNDMAAELGNDAVNALFKRELDAPTAGTTEAGAEDLENRAPPVGEEEGLAGVTLAHFRAHMPTHTYIYTPSRELWPGASVNARIPPVSIFAADGKPDLDKDGKPKTLPATAWLDRYKPVEQMTWAPGLPMLIRNRLISEGGWILHRDATCFNRYRAPTIKLGDPTKAGPWLEHVERVFKNDTQHIIRWLAHRVQRPDEKINHALVLGGSQGIGKDTMLDPLKHAIGPWNFAEISPQHLLGRFNGFLQSVILRISEARDLGDLNRYQFYDHMKAYTAAPPDVLRVDEKHLREYNVLNCTGVIITTNHKADGIFLPADDRRHFVAWSDATKDDFGNDYWPRLWAWYAAGGNSHVAAYLTGLDLSAFDAKAPPPKTPAFWDIVDANRSSEDSEFADVLDAMGNPAAMTIESIIAAAESMTGVATFVAWIRDRKSRRVIPHRMENCGYVPVRNSSAQDGLWRIAGKRQVVYARSELPVHERLDAASKL
jgi:phage/plasmid primase-like uncharacterized protein